MKNDPTKLDCDKDGTAVAQILAAGKAIATTSVASKFTENGHTLLVLETPQGYKVENVSLALPADARPKPVRKVDTVQVHDIASFNTYVNTHKTKGAAIFVNVADDGATFTGVLNYHDSENADFGDHRVVYHLKRSKEWQAWMKNNSRALSQVQFCEHIEDCMELITSPMAADLLALMQNLSGKADVAFKQAINLRNGSVKLAYDEDVTIRSEVSKQAGEMEVPEYIYLAIPPFENVAPYKAIARLRTRIADRRLVFVYETGADLSSKFAMNLALITKAATTDLLQQVQDATKITPLLGTVS